MRFKLVYGNHWDFGLAVADTVLMLKYGLEDLGYRADVEQAFVPGEINILLENFSADFVQDIERSWVPGTGVIVVATEYLTGATFNDLYEEPAGEVHEKDLYQRRQMWQDRYNNFIRLLPRMTAVWHLDRTQAGVYAEAFPDLPVAYLPHGYSDRFPTVRHRPDAEKDIDVLFTGSRTRYRDMVLDELRAAGLRVAAAHQRTAPFHREDLLARTRLAVNIKQHEAWTHESNSRLFYHLSNASLVLTDPCSQPSDLNPYVATREEDWVEAVRKQLARGNFVARGRAARDRVAAERPMARMLPSLLAGCGLAGAIETMNG